MTIGYAFVALGSCTQGGCERLRSFIKPLYEHLIDGLHCLCWVWVHLFGFRLQLRGQLSATYFIFGVCVGVFPRSLPEIGGCPSNGHAPLPREKKTNESLRWCQPCRTAHRVWDLNQRLVFALGQRAGAPSKGFGVYAGRLRCQPVLRTGGILLAQCSGSRP